MILQEIAKNQMTTSLTIMSYLYNMNFKIDNLLKIFSWICKSRFCHAIVHKASFSWYLSSLFFGLCWILHISHSFCSITPFLSPFTQMLRFLLCWFTENNGIVFYWGIFPCFQALLEVVVIISQGTISILSIQGCCICLLIILLSFPMQKAR